MKSHFTPALLFLPCLILCGLLPKQVSGAEKWGSFTLKNGLRVDFLVNNAVPMVHVFSAIRAGSMRESVKLKGTSHFLEHLVINRETQHLPSGELARKVRNMGGFINGHTGFDYITLELSMPAGKLTQAVGFQREMLFNATFSSESFEVERKAILEEFYRDRGSRKKWLRDTLRKQFFPSSHPYWSEVTGDSNQIKSLKINQVRKYYHRYFSNTANFRLVVVGDFSPDRLKKIVFNYFEKLHSPCSLPMIRVPVFKQFLRRKKTVVKQIPFRNSVFAIAFPAPSIDDKAHNSFDVLSYFIGHFRGSFFQKELRKKFPGLLKITTDFRSSALPGIMMLFIEFSGQSSKEVGREVLTLLARVVNGQFSEEEFQQSKRDLMRSLLYSGSSPERIAYSHSFFSAKSEDYHYKDYEESLKRVTSGAMIATARRFINFSHAAYFIGYGTDTKEFDQKGGSSGNGHLRQHIVEQFSKTLKDVVVLGKPQTPIRMIPQNRVNQQLLASIPSFSFNLSAPSSFVTREVSASALSSLVILAPAGTACDGKNGGLSRLTVELLQKGCKNLPLSRLRTWVNKNLLRFKVRSGKDQVALIFEGPSDKTRELFYLAHSVLAHPLFLETDILDLKKGLISRGRAVGNNNRALATHKIHRLAFWPHPYANNGYGSQNSFSRIDRSLIRSFFNNHYAPEKLVFSYCGRASRESLLQFFSLQNSGNAQQYFGDAIKKRYSVSGTSLIVNSPRKREITLKGGGEQGFFNLAFFLDEVTIKHSFPALLLLDQILGRGMGSRLWSLRQKEGLAYFLKSRVLPYKLGGLLEISLGVRPKNIDHVEKSVCSLLKGLSHNPCSEEELGRAKIRLLSRLKKIRRHMRNQAFYQGLDVTMNRPESFDYHLMTTLIDRVTPVEITTLASTVFHKKNRFLIKICPEASK